MGTANDWRLFGYCHLSEWEWGYLMLSDLQKLRLSFGLTIERDLYISEHVIVKDLVQ
ncbi:DUF2958 domain-containing protein [uncultured Alistipes sp.]|uniref:DUF2958 domain-containing protein n=1 Tax=uncultured Alistipes sp. TaxID=538949 RepID=UPI002597A07E|nr:DUF2958 domain-containing protein [uncultured Alistipes sp.]